MAPSKKPAKTAAKAEPSAAPPAPQMLNKFCACPCTAQIEAKKLVTIKRISYSADGRSSTARRLSFIRGHEDRG